MACCLRISGLLFSVDDVNHFWHHLYALALTNEYKYPLGLWGIPSPSFLSIPTAPGFLFATISLSNILWVPLPPGGSRSRPYAVLSAF